MASQPNILFCGTLNNKQNFSWDKTNGYLLEALSKKTICSHLDYSIKNVFVRKIYELLSGLLYGETLIRDPLFDFLMELNFRRQFHNLQKQPELVIHSSAICIPKGFEKKCPHVMYTDASIMGSIRYNDFKPGRKTLAVFTKESKKYINRLKYVFTFNEWTRQSLIEDFNINGDKVINVGFGANLDPYYGEKNYANNQILIVLRRGLEKNKGLYLLLDAFKIAYKQNPLLKLNVVGTTLEPIDGVTYYEGQPRARTIELFQQASLFAMPALYEPNGMVFIEALANKTPILGLNRLAFPEFCGYGKYGFIVEDNAEDIAGTILHACKDPELLRNMGELGQNYAINNYTWDIVVSKIIKASTS